MPEPITILRCLVRAGQPVRRAHVAIAPEAPGDLGRLLGSREPHDGIGALFGRAEQRPHDSLEGWEGGLDPGRLEPL